MGQAKRDAESREEKAGRLLLGLALGDGVCVGLVLSCLLISACLALSVGTAEKEGEKTKDLRDGEAGHGGKETDTLATDSRTRAALVPSD